MIVLFCWNANVDCGTSIAQFRGKVSNPEVSEPSFAAAGCGSPSNERILNPKLRRPRKGDE